MFEDEKDIDPRELLIYKKGEEIYQVVDQMYAKCYLKTLVGKEVIQRMRQALYFVRIEFL